MKKIKIMLIALMIFFSIITILNPYYAWAKITKTERDGGHTADEIIEEGKSFIDTGKEKTDDKIKQDNMEFCAVLPIWTVLLLFIVIYIL